MDEDLININKNVIKGSVIMDSGMFKDSKLNDITINTKDANTTNTIENATTIEEVRDLLLKMKPGNDKIEILLSQLILAINKSIPKQPVKKKIVSDLNYVYTVCPNCECDVYYQTYTGMNGRIKEYCPWCGQKLDWTDFNDKSKLR